MKVFKDGKMSDYIPGGIIDGKLTLEAEAERLFPYPINVCPYTRLKINWKREQWVIEQVNSYSKKS